MRIAYTLSELRAIRATMQGSCGLIPTMGALHAGHGSLVQRARQECDCVGASIFVNPAQFGAGEDFGKYPRTLERDLDLFEKLGADFVFTPSVDVMYPPGFQTWVEVADVTTRLEGQCRPGHFRGVTTVVAKLLNAFTPTRAYFGQKDAQQVVVLQRMVRDLNLPVELVVCPTVREADGLALSSRNAYLNPAERKAATVLYRALCAARSKYDAGERNADALRATMKSVLEGEPLANAQYVSAADPETLEELASVENGVLLSLAVRIGQTRLIDNFLL
ncbi:MAG TPA: pantoate--beta-alanine ligase [Acidobacteriota bacterium]|nr:pantoate--beta-alanine ligase [Acidobacteriota bacterium]